MNWQPSASIENLQKRAAFIANIRLFFAERQVLEVETPILSHATVTDPYVIGIPALYRERGLQQDTLLYLQTSPEYAMKRLLAAGSGPIFQLCKSFRQGDVGKIHNPEFTMLEWYRPGFDHHALMDEMDALLQFLLNTPPAERMSYKTLFETYLHLDPHTANLDTLAACAEEKQISVACELTNTTAWLDILWTHCIEPHVGKNAPLFLYDFPIAQAALAKVRRDENLASRFEVYFKGIELANGFHELQDAKEQRLRFENELAYRQVHHLPTVPMDEHFLAALEHGLPDCAGVALGVDRLFMLALGEDSLKNVMSFGFNYC